MNTFSKGGALLLSAALLGAPAAAGAQEWAYSGGLQYSRAAYIFDQQTDAYSLSSSLRVGVGPLDLSVSAPLVLQNGGLVTVVGGGVPLPTGGTQAGVISRRQKGQKVGTRKGGRSLVGGGARAAPAALVRSGAGIPSFSTGPGFAASADSLDVLFDDSFDAYLGDPTLYASAEIYSGFGAVRSLRVTGSTKTPVNDVSSGVGSGAWDYGFGSSVVLGAGSDFLAFLDVSYWWFGDMPDLELRDAVSVGAGISKPAFAGNGSVLVTLTGMSAMIGDMEAPWSLAGSASHTWGEHGFLSVGAGLGLTESAPDVFVQLGWSVAS